MVSDGRVKNKAPLCNYASQRLAFSSDKSRAFAERNAQQATLNGGNIKLLY